MNIFVYGTLKQGFGNHARFLKREPDYVGTIKARLYVSGLPYIRPGEGVVHGEVYSVDNDTLKGLDMLEGHPGWYRREKVVVETKDGKKVEAQAYFYQNGMDESYHVPEGNYKGYR